MNRIHGLGELSADELLELQALLRAENTPGAVFRRARLIWLLASRYSIAQASEYVGLHYTNAHRWVKRFEAEGLAGLQSRARSGRPRVYDVEAEERVIDLATSRPPDLGLGFTTWSLPKLARHLHQDEGFGAISPETVRGILRRRGLGWRAGRTWCESNDPDYEGKKGPS
jgi:transposase